MVPSNVFLGLILVGGVALVVGGAFYPRARASEEKAALAKAADAILEPEIVANMDFAAGLKAALLQDKTPVNNFETASWETASRGGLLSGYAPERSTKIIGFYNNIYRARANLSELQSYAFGEGSTRSNRGDMMIAYRGVLSLAVEEILKLAQPPAAKVPAPAKPAPVKPRS